MSAEKSGQLDFRKTLETLSRRHDIRRIFNAFIRLSACALSAQTREAEYLEEANKWESLEYPLDTAMVTARHHQDMVCGSTAGRTPSP